MGSARLVNIFDLSELLSLLVFFPLAWLIHRWSIRKMNVKGHHWLVDYSFQIRMACGLLVAFVYLFYYKSGDMIAYYNGAKYLSKIFFENPFQYIAILLDENPTQQIKSNVLTPSQIGGLKYIASKPTSFFVCKFFSPVSIFTGNSLLGMLITTSLFINSACLILYKKLLATLTIKRVFIGASVFGSPSFLAWSTPPFKDTIAILGLILLLIQSLRIIKSFHFNTLVLSLPTMIIASVLIISTKPYIFYPYMPLLALLVFLSVGRNAAPITKYSIRFSLAFAFAVSIYFSFESISQESERYSIDGVFENTAIIYNDLQSDYNYNNREGSRYELNPMDGTAASALSNFWIGIATALYRPMVWEVHNFPSLFSALENLVLAYLMLRLLLAIGARKIISIISSHPIFIFSVLFVILFGFFVGITSGNFGNLSRYRIPLIPFYLLFTLGVYAINQNRKQVVHK